MSTASMALLKGAPKDSKAVAAAAAKELQTPPKTSEAEVEKAGAEVEEVSVEIDDMTAEQLDALVAEHEIKVPDTWKKMTLAKKKSWLNETHGDAGKEAAAVTETAEESPNEALPSDSEPADTPPPAKAAAAKPVKEKTAKTAKAGAKTTVLATSDVKVGEVIEPGQDIIVATVNQIENLKEDDARALIRQLRDGTDFTFFKLGGVLSLIQAQNWFKPYASFREFVETDYGINYRRAMYWVSIYNGLVESGVPWESVKNLGWTKLATIIPILSKDNAERWIGKAQALNVLQLQETVKQAVAKKEGKLLGHDTSTETSNVSTKTFKVHPNQRETIEAALMKARDASGTEADTVALEYICLDYLAGNAKAGGGDAVPLETTLAAAGLDDAVAAFEKAFPQANMTVEIEG